MNLLRSEILKLRTVVATRWLLAAAVLVSILNVLAVVLTAGPDETVRLTDADLLARSAGSAATAEVVMLVVGILALSQEFRFGTATATFLTSPKRVGVLLAKAAGVAIAGLCFAAVCVPAVLATAVVLLRARAGAVVWDRDLAEVVLGVVVVMLTYGPLGLALAAFVRNHIAAIVTSLVWVFIVEQVLLNVVPSVGRWTPVGAAAATAQLGRLATRGTLLPAWAGALVLVAYTAAFLAMGAVAVARRDVTGPA